MNKGAVLKDFSRTEVRAGQALLSLFDYFSTAQQQIERGDRKCGTQMTKSQIEDSHAEKVLKDAIAARIQVGARVKAKWRALVGGRKWYKGTITLLNSDHTVDVLYDDGDAEPKVELRFIQLVDKQPNAPAAGVTRRGDKHSAPNAPDTGGGCQWRGKKAGVAAGQGTGIRIGDLLLGKFKGSLGYIGWYKCRVVAQAEGGKWFVEWEDGDKTDNLKEQRHLKRRDGAEGKNLEKGESHRIMKSRRDGKARDLSQEERKTRAIMRQTEEMENTEKAVKAGPRSTQLEGRVRAGSVQGRGSRIRIGDLMLGHYKSTLGYVGWHECKVAAEAEGDRWVVEWEDGDEHDTLKGARHLKKRDAAAEQTGGSKWEEREREREREKTAAAAETGGCNNGKRARVATPGYGNAKATSRSRRVRYWGGRDGNTQGPNCEGVGAGD